MTTTIIPPRVALVDERTGLIAREWYLFLLALRTTTDAASVDLSAIAASIAAINAALAGVNTNLDEIASQPLPDIAGLMAQLALTDQYAVEPSTAGLAARVAALESAVNDLRLGVPVL